MVPVVSFCILGSKDAIVSFDTIASVSKSLAAKNRKRWPTGFFTQFRMLTWRNYKQAKGRVLHPFDIMKYIFLAAVIGALFYQIRKNEDSVRDIQGMVTFITFYTCNWPPSFTHFSECTTQ